MAVREGRKGIANPQERPHPFLEVNPICTVPRGMNKMERKRGLNFSILYEKKCAETLAFPSYP